MPKENKDRDAITSKAIGIASEKERDAYIAQACDNDAELKRQVEEGVAAHFKAHDQKEPDRIADTEAPSPEQAPEQAGEKQSKRHELWELARKHPRAMSAAVIILLLLLTAAGGGTGVAVWALHKEGQARKSEKKADAKSKQAEKEEEKLKGQLHQSKEARKVVEKERDQARKEQEKARRSEEETKAILQFFKGKLLSAGRAEEGAIPKAFWDGDQGKDVTLLQAVDKAASQVADAFADRPLAETSIRETLGSAYLNMGEAEKAVKQYERALALHEAMQGVNHSDTAACRNELAKAYRLAGRTTEAARLIGRKPTSSDHAAALAVHGAMLLSQKKPVEAELKLRECLSIRQKIQGDDWSTFDTKAMLGEALVEQKKYADAEPLLLSGYEGLKQRQDKIPSADKVRLTKALERLVQLYEGWGKKDKAEQWRKELETTKAAKET